MKQSFYESEKQKLDKLSNFQLPNYFKKIGWTLFGISLILTLLFKFTEDPSPIISVICKKGMLVGLLLVAIAREKVEDEMIEKLRGKSFSAAFIFGVLYALIQPLVNYFVGVTIKPEPTTYSDLGDFQVLWFMLFIYVMLFQLYKRIA